MKCVRREFERPRRAIDGDHGRARALGHVVGQLALSAADVQHALAGLDALHEEVVVTGQPVLGVYPAVVVDGAAVDGVVRIRVDLE